MKSCFATILAGVVLLWPAANAANASPLLNFDHNSAGPLAWGQTNSPGEDNEADAGGPGKGRGHKAFSAATPVRFHSNDYDVSFDIPAFTPRPSDRGKPAIDFAGIISAPPVSFGAHGPSKPNMGWLTHLYTVLAFIAGQSNKWPHPHIQVNPPHCDPGGGGGPVSTVPLPPALPLLATGLAALGVFARRRKNV